MNFNLKKLNRAILNWKYLENKNQISYIKLNLNINGYSR